MDDLRWKVTFDTNGLQQRFPFANAELGLTDDDRDREVSRSVTMDLALQLVAGIPQNIRDVAADEATIQPNTYLCRELSDWREVFWDRLNQQVPDTVPPLLRMSIEHDKHRQLLLAGGKIWFDENFNVCQDSPEKLEPLLKRLCDDCLKVPRSLPDEFPFCAEPDAFATEVRFRIGRSPYYDFWQMSTCEEFWDFCDSGLVSLKQHPSALLFEHAIVRYADRVERDTQLCILFAGALLALPAIEIWVRRFASSNCIRVSPSAIASVLSLVFRDDFCVAVWKKVLSLVGVNMTSLVFCGEEDAFSLTGDLSEDELLALRLLVPPKHLHLFFTLDVSALDSNAVLA